jgi:small subunit ribosomal protein S21
MSSERRPAAPHMPISDRARVVVAPETPFELTLKRFKRSVERAGVMRELKNHEAYRSPSVRRRLKSRRARMRDATSAAKRARASTSRSGTNEKPWGE